MALYKAEFNVDAEPMTLGEYCDMYQPQFLSGHEYKTDGYITVYQSIDTETGKRKVGWITKELFEAFYKQIQVLEE